MLTYRPSVLSDAFPISLHARDIDRIEWNGLGPGGISLTGQIVSSIEKSAMAWTACWSNTPIAVWGLTPTPLSTVGIPWMIGVPEMENHVRPLLVVGRDYVKQMLAERSTLVNYVHADNVKAQAWLRKLGFQIDAPTIPLGSPVAPYFRFHLTTNV